LGVEKAREILEQNLAAPPSLADIARKSGVCVTCLTEKFRKQFGTTVFGYLRQRRLEQAKELMTRHGLSASEAAWEVGYSSLSSFHRAFMAKYGARRRGLQPKGVIRHQAAALFRNGIRDNNTFHGQTDFARVISFFSTTYKEMSPHAKNRSYRLPCLGHRPAARLRAG
jgi:AraC-like DNA-binding protein